MAQPEQDVVLSVQKIRPGGAEKLESRFASQAERKDALVEQLEEEGITVESVFIHEIDGDQYLLYYIEADDFDEAIETWKASDSAATAEYQALIEETLDGGLDGYHADRADNIFHIDTTAATD
jgi:hypothetical protein